MHKKHNSIITPIEMVIVSHWYFEFIVVVLENLSHYSKNDFIQKVKVGQQWETPARSLSSIHSKIISLFIFKNKKTGVELLCWIKILLLNFINGKYFTLLDPNYFISSSLIFLFVDYLIACLCMFPLLTYISPLRALINPFCWINHNY